MEFLLDPEIVYLNHGAFGACPRVVHDEYQRWQRTLERDPTRFLQRELPGLLAQARSALAAFVGADAGDLVFVPNPTFAVNEIIRSLDLGPGDEVLTTNHEYGACRNAWQFSAERRGFDLIEADLDVTFDPDEMVETMLTAVTDRTRVLFVSHITSSTAITVPVAEICRRMRGLGVTSIIDGAHAPGQIDLDVSAVGADFYVGACHKWLCAPKGASLLVARRESQPLLDPLVVGWGWGDRRKIDVGSDFLDIHEWLGTRDPAAYLAVPAAIDFQLGYDWPDRRAECHRMAVAAVDVTTEIEGITRVHDDVRFEQMALVELSGPAWDGRGASVQRQLFDDFDIEVPVTTWARSNADPRTFLRVSVQAYNTMRDVERLTAALDALAAG